jgi:tRNA-splicing ligase RtcB (3'-phosphate/5'-hydroxy nucleic acid ligase)
MNFEKIDANRWLIPQTGDMRVPALVFASETMLQQIRDDKSPQQLVNVAQLPGIVKYAIGMPDIHWGYGFPIGGVAAFDADEGVVSPGGVGYDINCGVRLLRTNLQRDEVQPRLSDLSLALFHCIPSGVGAGTRDKLDKASLKQVLQTGARWCIERGWGFPEDLEAIEEQGCMQENDPALISERAYERGMPQLGSLGSGNHFCEISFVEEIYDTQAAAAFGLFEQQITVMIHSGSRGLGYQVCDDYLRRMLAASQQYGIALPDRQLCAAPLHSHEANEYLTAMACAVNYAFANRQTLAHRVRELLMQFFGYSETELAARLVYDVCHNIAKFEEHTVDGKKRRLCVHRKGATRAFPKGHTALPEAYRDIGQPVLIPGDMGRYSYVLVGQPKSMQESFGSSCHGAGRHMSRAQAKKYARGHSIFRELQERGIYVRSDSVATVAEEISEAYKDVAEVVEVVDNAGLASKVAKLVPMAVVKG